MGPLSSTPMPDLQNEQKLNADLWRKAGLFQLLIMNGHPYLSGVKLGVDLRTDLKKTGS